jgi:hypothetical protein
MRPEEDEDSVIKQAFKNWWNRFKAEFQSKELEKEINQSYEDRVINFPRGEENHSRSKHEEA